MAYIALVVYGAELNFINVVKENESASQKPALSVDSLVGPKSMLPSTIHSVAAWSIGV